MLQATSYKLQANKGIAALLIIIIISAATLIMAYNSSILGLGELDSGYTSQRGSDAFFVADSCIEEILRRIRLNVNYGIGAGAINLPVLEGFCTVNITDIGGGQRLVDIVGTSGEYNKHIQVELTLVGNIITVDKWEERDD